MNELNVYGAKPKEQTLASVTTAMATTRQAQEVQAAMIVAKRFPRDEQQSAERILAACSRRTLAENALYSYPRGGTEVTGPSIRLAEALAQSWGNMDFGYIELEQANNESKVMAYAWDLETNTRQSKVFTVPHRRDTSSGSKVLTDSRDIYETVANQAARRVRSCILAIIPGDVVEMSVKQCEATLRAGAEGVPIGVRIENMVKAFAEFEVTPEQLRGYIGKNVEAFDENDLVRLQKVYRSIKDGIVGNDYFLQRMRESAKEEPKEEPAPEQAGEKKEEAPKPSRGKSGKKVSLDDL